MCKLVNDLKTWMFRFQKNTVRSLRSWITEEQQIDWAGIDETRNRLVRMRVRTCPQMDMRPHGELTRTFGGRAQGELSRTLCASFAARSNDRQAMVRWFANLDPAVNAKALEKNLRETIYKRKSEHVIDEDWLYQKKTNEYETLLLPNVNYDINPAVTGRGRVAGFLTAAPAPAAS
jgi:hypothetical protein